MTQVKQIGKNQARGFALGELLLAIAVIALLVAIGAGVYSSMRSGINADDMGAKTVELAADIQKNWRTAGDYSTVSADAINKLALIHAPITMSGTDMQDGWGNTMTLNGTRSSFAITIGGATAPLSRDDCSSIANRLTIASVVRVGASASAAAGIVTGGNLFKNGATIDQTQLITGCSEGNTIIAAQFR